MLCSGAMGAMTITTAFIGTSIPSVDPKFIPLQLRRAKCFTLWRCHRISVSNAVENNPETVEKESSSSSSISAPRSFSSLITASNIRKALNGIEVVSVDHYARIGIPRGCTFDEVRDAFKRKCEDLKQQELDDEKVQSKLQDLKESYEILSSEEERRFYDWSLARAENQDRYVWPYEVDITQSSSAPGPPKVEDDPRPTAYVGYFFLGWLLLAFTLSITLK